ncbi:MAG TPA: cell division protein SepF [Candidatus Acidoferrales bacterium]|nr:cell division protein SepF [Candidatus Acidoferrales bacterium]
MAQKSLIDRIFGSRPHAETDEYLELDLGEYEEVFEEEPVGTYVKVAELINASNLTPLKDEVYKGNIVVIDISHIKQDRVALDRIVKELKQVAKDIHGDIAGLGDDQIIVTPMSIKIDRRKLGGSH